MPKLDARTIKATPTVLRQIRKFQSVIKGESGAVRVKNAGLLRELRESGYQVVKAKGRPARVLVPKATTETTRIVRGEVIVESKAIKYTAKNIPRGQSLLAWLEANAHKKLPSSTRLAFKYRGNGSYATYPDYQSAVDDLLSYMGVEQAIESGRSKDQAEEIQGIEFIEFKATARNEAAYNRAKEARRAERAKINRKKFSASNVNENQKQKDRLRKQKARDNMTEKQKAEYKRKAKERAAKSRRKK